MKAVFVAILGILISNAASAVSVGCESIVAKEVKDTIHSRYQILISEPVVEGIAKTDAAVLLKKQDAQVYEVYYRNDLEYPSNSDTAYKATIAVQNRSVGPGGNVVIEDQQIVTLRNKDCSSRFLVMLKPLGK